MIHNSGALRLNIKVNYMRMLQHFTTTLALALAALGLTAAPAMADDYDDCLASENLSHYEDWPPTQDPFVYSNEIFFIEYDPGHYSCLSTNQMIGDARTACEYAGFHLGSVDFGAPYAEQWSQQVIAIDMTVACGDPL